MTPLGLSEILIAVWRQAFIDKADTVKLSADSYPVSQSKAKRLRQVEFVIDGNTFIGIEQNPNTKSRWAAMAWLGKPVMQFSVLRSSQSFYEPNNQTDNHQGPYQSVSQHLQPPQT
jgi:hypothetical protein